MKPLPYVDLDLHYEKEFKSSKTKSKNWDYYRCSLEELIPMIEKEKNLIDFKNELLAITQLYFDGLVDKKSNNLKCKNLIKQKNILDKLCSIDKSFVGAFYKGKNVNLDRIKEYLLSNVSEIVKYGSKDSAKKRHLVCLPTYVQCFGMLLSDGLSEIGPIDSLVCIASGGFEPSFLAMNILEKNYLTIVRYSRIEKKDSGVAVLGEEDFVSNVKDKNVLIVEDIISTGQTLSNVIDYVHNVKPKSLYGIVVLGGSFTTLGGLRVEIINRGNGVIFKYEGKNKKKKF